MPLSQSLRALIGDYLRRPLPDDTRLLLIVASSMVPWFRTIAQCAQQLIAINGLANALSDITRCWP